MVNVPGKIAYRPSTVSKLEPCVFMDTLPVAAAVKEYQMDRDAPGMVGIYCSPVSLVAPVVDADIVPAVSGTRLDKEGTMARMAARNALVDTTRPARQQALSGTASGSGLGA